MSLNTARVIVMGLIVASIACSALAHTPRRVGDTLPEGPVSLWMQAQGLLQYGLTPQEVEKALETKTFCGRRLRMQTIAWPLPNQKPPTQGPYYGVFLAEKLGTKEWDDIPLVVLIAEKDILKYAAIFMFGGSTMQWIPLPGDPVLLSRLEVKQDDMDRAYAPLYWSKSQAIRGFIQSAHSRQEIVDYVQALMKDVPSHRWALATASSPDMLLKERNPGYKAIIQCDLESRVHWDEILAIAVTPSSLSITEKPVEWKHDILANVYIRSGQAVGVVFDQIDVNERVAPMAHAYLAREWHLYDSMLYWAY